MAQIDSIRELFLEKGLSYVAVARGTGFDVKTMKKYIRMEDFNRPAPEPRKVRLSKLDAYKKQIDGWLEGNKQERRKQRYTAMRIFDRFVEEHSDFDYSYRLVTAYVAKRKNELCGGGSEFYMPPEHIPGEAQVYFRKADFFEGNVRHKGCYLNVSFAYSDAGCLQLFKGGNMQCLAEALMNVFAHVSGVPTTLWLDNASPVVKKTLKNGDR
jgi:transposase